MEQRVKKWSVSIGIPAFNEEENIAYLLRDLLAQTESSYLLEKIYVYSDGSTDATESIVRSLESEKIELIVGPGRKGAAHGQNTIMTSAEGDVLVLLDADTEIRDKRFLEKLIEPIIQQEADLTSVKHMPLPARTFFERTLETSVLVKDIIFESYNNGHNVYTCYGIARAFSKRLYKQMTFVNSVAEDAYSFLYCTYHGYSYRSVPEAVIYYRLPGNLCDHGKQSTRFFKGSGKFTDIFTTEFVQQATYIPCSAYMKALPGILAVICKRPLTAFSYCILVVFFHIRALFGGESPEMWAIATSSKKLH